MAEEQIRVRRSGVPDAVPVTGAPEVTAAPAGAIERASRIAAAGSVGAIVVLLLALHPDIAWPLQAAGAAACLIAWLAARSHPEEAQSACVLAGVLAMPLLRLATGREAPLLDVIWMAGLSGALLRESGRPGWSLPGAWRPLAGGWALVLSLAWPVLAGREIGFDPAGLRDGGATTSWAQWPAPLAASWILYWILLQLLGLLWLDSIAARRARQPDHVPRPVHALWIGTTAASVVALVQGTVDIAFLNPPFWASAGRATGTLLEANGYGHAAAIAGPVAFALLRPRRGAAHAWAWPILAVNWLGVWMSGSRTALLCAAAAAAGLAVASRFPPARRVRLRRAGSAALIAGAAVVLALAAGAVGPVRRFAEIPREERSIAALWERGGYGAIASRMVREYPLTGVGAGSFHFLAPDYWRIEVNDALAPDNAQNWWRHQAAELGVLGSAPVLVWSGLIAWCALAGRRRPFERDGAGIPAPIVRALLAGIGLSSLLGVPTQNPIVLLWFFVLAAWLGTPADPEAPGARGERWRRAAWTISLALAIAYAGGHALLARTSLSVAARAERFRRDYVIGAYAPEQLPDGLVFRWTDEESRFRLPAATGSILLRLWVQHPDIAERPVAVQLWSPCGMAWERTFTGTDPVSIGILAPGDRASIDMTVRVSRTWQPSDYGASDSRSLGAAVAATLDASAREAKAQAHTVSWPACPDRE